MNREERARQIVDSCTFGYAGNEIDENYAEDPNVIEANYKWLVERIAAALDAVWDEAIETVRKTNITPPVINHFWDGFEQAKAMVTAALQAAKDGKS